MLGARCAGQLDCMPDTEAKRIKAIRVPVMEGEIGAPPCSNTAIGPLMALIPLPPCPARTGGDHGVEAARPVLS